MNMGFGSTRGRRLRSNLYLAWVYTKSLLYSLKQSLRRERGRDRFIYK